MSHKTAAPGPTPPDDEPDAWDPAQCRPLIEQLETLRSAMLGGQLRLKPVIEAVAPAHRDSAVNLAHFLALRRVDLRPLQQRLARLGLSSLGRSESHVLSNVDKVLGLLHRLVGRRWTTHRGDEPFGFRSGALQLQRNAARLFGAPPAARGVRIMVTLPSEAATDAALVDALVASGMDVARINCAHDGPDAWSAMAAQVRRAAKAAGRELRIHMDLAGPKLRTGALEPATPVLKLRPRRDEFGFTIAPLRLGLRVAGSAAIVIGAEVHVGVDGDWLAQLEPGDRIDLSDARAASRSLTVRERQAGGVLVDCPRTTYLVPRTRLRLQRRNARPRDSLPHDLPERAAGLRLQRGDTLQLVGTGLGHGARPDAPKRSQRDAAIACTLAEALAAIRKGDPVWFDDGRIGAIARRRSARGVALEITTAREGGELLLADKGINLPGTPLHLPALTEKDLADLAVVARQADTVGLSFAQSADDVRALRAGLHTHGAGELGIVLKIETRRGFEHLPELLFAALEGPSAGVMIARGDLAVECGYERLAEVQEEILWACEAAHVPVVWATQVLESLAKTGLPSRAEITDAAMGGRAECVMLNKGPHVADAVRVLDEILRRMQSHQAKKQPLLRALKSWRLAAGSS